MNNTNLKGCFPRKSQTVKNQTIDDYKTKKIGILANKVKLVLF